MSFAKLPHFKHNKSGNTYVVVDEAKLKLNGEWVPCIIYCSKYTGTSEVYVRLKEEFQEKFTPL